MSGFGVSCKKFNILECDDLDYDALYFDGYQPFGNICCYIREGGR